MAGRSYKTGVDWFQHEVTMSTNIKSQKLIRATGMEGYGVVQALLERIYQREDFELSIPTVEILNSPMEMRGISVEMQRKLVECSDALCVMADEFRMTRACLVEIIECACVVGLFSLDEYTTRGVLTSPGIKQRVVPILEKRLSDRVSYKGNSAPSVPAVEKAISTVEMQHSDAEIPISSNREEKRRVVKSISSPHSGKVSKHGMGKGDTQSADALIGILYKHYPRKSGTAAVSAKQRKVLLAVGEVPLIDAITRFAANVRGKEPNFIPNFATWANTLYKDWLPDSETPVEETVAAQAEGTTEYERIGSAIIPKGASWRYEL